MRLVLPHIGSFGLFSKVNASISTIGIIGTLIRKWALVIAFSTVVNNQPFNSIAGTNRHALWADGGFISLHTTISPILKSQS